MEGGRALPKSSINQQIGLTLKLLVILLAEPKITAEALAKTLSVSVAWVFAMTARLREAGLDIEYDRTQQRYSVGLSESFAEGFIPKLANRLNRAMKASGLRQPPERFVSSLDRYTVAQFAQYLGSSRQNIQNMIIGYKGQQLPEGWIAFRISDGGRWFIQKMETGRSGKDYRIPGNIKEAAVEYVIGRGGMKVLGGSRPATVQRCIVFENGKRCENPQLAHFLCSFHYYQARRHPEFTKQWMKEARSHGIPAIEIKNLREWSEERSKELKEGEG